MTHGHTPSFNVTVLFKGDCLKRQQGAKLSLGQPTVLPHSTFEGHVTSSVTWPFDSPYVISYWWSFGTEFLSLAVFEILRSN